MKFFTPRLYLRYAARTESSTDRAEAEWDEAVDAYHAHLGRFSGTMNDRVRTFAEDLCLHNAELLAWQEDIVTLPELREARTPVAILSLRGIGRRFTLVYLSWGEIILSTAPPSWNSASSGLRWLYDEIDLAPETSPFPRYHHHVMWSDGREMSVPFYDVIVHSFPDTESRPEPVTGKRVRDQGLPG